MAYADTLKIFEILRQKFDEPESKIIASAVENALETNNAALFDNIATKGDLAELKAATKGDLAELKAATKTDMAELKTELAEMKAELIKWMFLFWLGQFASITAVLFLFFKR